VALLLLSRRAESHFTPFARRKPVIKRFLALLGLVCAALPLAAEVGPPSDIPTRAKGAQRVVVAHVLDVRAQFQTNRFGDQLIVSTAMLDVSETLKGDPVSVLQVEVEGGTVGDLTLKVSDLPVLARGERAVFFLDDASGGVMLPHERGRGILKLSQSDQIQNSAVTLAEIRRQVRDALRSAR
jgi:hypothetical protein